VLENVRLNFFFSQRGIRPGEGIVECTLSTGREETPRAPAGRKKVLYFAKKSRKKVVLGRRSCAGGKRAVLSLLKGGVFFPGNEVEKSSERGRSLCDCLERKGRLSGTKTSVLKMARGGIEEREDEENMRKKKE